MGPQTVVWHKSTYSNPGNDCVEVARLSSHVAIRDSKNKPRGTLGVTLRAWAAFVASLGHG